MIGSLLVFGVNDGDRITASVITDYDEVNDTYRMVDNYIHHRDNRLLSQVDWMFGEDFEGEDEPHVVIEGPAP